MCDDGNYDNQICKRVNNTQSDLKGKLLKAVVVHLETLKILNDESFFVNLFPPHVPSACRSAFGFRQRQRSFPVVNPLKKFTINVYLQESFEDGFDTLGSEIKSFSRSSSHVFPMNLFSLLQH